MDDFLKNEPENQNSEETAARRNDSAQIPDSPAPDKGNAANSEIIEETSRQVSPDSSEQSDDASTSTENADNPTEQAGDNTAGEAVENNPGFVPPINGNPPPVYNPIKYTPTAPINDYKPMSMGLKIFSLALAAIIILTGTCLTGYFLGRNSVKSRLYNRPDVDLEEKPENTDQMTEAQVYEAVDKSLVGITVYNSSGKGSQSSGIVYSSDGYIVTNDHIYAEVAAAKFKIYTYDGKEYDAKYVAGDKVSDLAVLKIDNVKLTPAKFGNSDDVYLGEHVVAIGRTNDAQEASSITRGVVSAVNIRVQTTSSYSSRLIQTDSAINPGSSGGALVNMYGQVIGVTSSKLASVEYDAVGYAIPTTVMKRIVDELISEKKVVSRAKLGITYQAIDSITAEISGYDYVGLLIDTVDEESSLYGEAEKGDIITQINGIDVTRDDIVLDIIEQSSAGDTITVTIVTGNHKTKTVKAQLKANVSESSYSATEIINNDSQNGNSSGGNNGNGGSNGNGGNGTFDFPFGE